MTKEHNAMLNLHKDNINLTLSVHINKSYIIYENSIQFNSITKSLKQIFTGAIMLGSFYANAQVNCIGIAEWNGSTVYDPTSANKQAVYNNVLYTANWWIQNARPDLNSGVAGSGKPWTTVGTCPTTTTGTSGATSWTLNGNLANPTTAFLGTTDFKPLTFKVNNLNAGFIYPQNFFLFSNEDEGNWHGSYFRADFNGRVSIRAPKNQANQFNILMLYSSDATTPKATAGFKHYLGFSHAKYATQEEYAVINAYEFNSATGAGAGKDLILQNTNEGKVFIGTNVTKPTEKLEVQGNIKVSNDLIFDNGKSLRQALANNTGVWQQSTLNTNNIYYKTGLVGIGTDLFPNADYQLRVNGKILCKGLKVQATGWADYVFKPNYKLMNLDSLNMNKLLLQKVEELTLYTIQLHNRLKELEATKK
jgi:hypothetical protein